MMNVLDPFDIKANDIKKKKKISQIRDFVNEFNSHTC